MSYLPRIDYLVSNAYSEGAWEAGAGRSLSPTVDGLSGRQVTLTPLSEVRMPVRVNSADATAKWLTNLSAASDRMKSGAMGVQQAPGQAAAAAADKWLAKVTQAKAKFIARVSSVSLADWQNAYINVGIPRVAQGAQAKQQKVTAFFDQFLPYLSTGVAQIDKMPNVTLEDGIARASAMIRYNSKFKRS